MHKPSCGCQTLPVFHLLCLILQNCEVAVNKMLVQTMEMWGRILALINLMMSVESCKANLKKKIPPGTKENIKVHIYSAGKTWHGRAGGYIDLGQTWLDPTQSLVSLRLEGMWRMSPSLPRAPGSSMEGLNDVLAWEKWLDSFAVMQFLLLQQSLKCK